MTHTQYVYPSELKKKISVISLQFDCYISPCKSNFADALSLNNTQKTLIRKAVYPRV